jgi:1,6-anhydro-N-acetylmuramate kinase
MTSGRTLAERTATNICSACKHAENEGPKQDARCGGCFKVGFMAFEDKLAAVEWSLQGWVNGASHK